MKKSNTFRLAIFLLGFTTAIAQEKPNYKAVDAILQDKCIACHNHTTRKGELNLENFAALINGGKRGASIVPGKASESLLVKYIEGSLQPRMPLGDQLSAAEIKVIRDWIDAGAAGDGATGRQGDRAIAESTSKANIPDIKPTASVKAAISSLAFSPNGAMLALGSYKEIELLNASDRKIVNKIAGAANQVRAVAFSPDGKLLAAAGGNPAQFGEVKLYNVSDGKELATMRGHRDNIFALAFSPDGKMIATCSYDKMIKLWDVASGKELKTLKDHTDAVFAVAFSPDGKRLASAAADRTVKIWDATTGERLYTLSDALDAVNTIAFHPSGKYLAGAGADRIIHIWELGDKDAKRIRSLISHEDAINVISYSPDGKTLVSTGADKAIKLWNAADLSEIKVLEAQPDWALALAFSPDGKQLVVGRYDGSVVSYDLKTGNGTNIK
jgi:WD40 repeat protein/mono/diheme cytochrome c family protein